LLATENPEAFGNLVVEMLCKLAELDRDAYEYLVGGMISREQRSAGLKVALEQAKQALTLGHTDRVEERISAIEAWICAIEWLGSRRTVELASAEERDAKPGSPHLYVM
jgi:hypothetical protein